MRKVAHPELRRQPLKPQAAQQRRGMHREGGAVDMPARLRQRTDHDVLGHCEIGKDRQLLRQHADAQRQRVGGGPDVARGVLDHDRAAVAGIVPGQDLHQRRLAGAIGAEQGYHLAGVELNPTSASTARRRTTCRCLSCRGRGGLSSHPNSPGRDPRSPSGNPACAARTGTTRTHPEETCTRSRPYPRI